MYIYYPSNATVYVRQVGGPNAVTEQWISSGPDSVIILSGSYPPTASTAFISASYAIMYTTSMSLATTASYANTSSYSLNSSLAPTASYAGTASVVNLVTTTYGATSSFNPLTGISQGSCIMWINPSTGSYMDTYTQYPATIYGQIIRYMKDFSGQGRHLATTAGGLSKYMLLNNVGQNNNKTGMWIDYVNGCSLQSATIASPTYPLWLFVVAKMPTGSATTQGVFDGIGGSNRFLCQLGTSVQIYSGASLSGNVTGSLTGSIQAKWFLQSFKNTAGGAGSSPSRKETHSL